MRIRRSKQEPGGAASAQDLVSPERRRGWTMLAMLLAALIGGGAVIGVIALMGNDTPAAAQEATDRNTTAIETRDLIEYQDLDGTLGFPDAVTVAAAAQGVLTDVPEKGSEIERGEALYEVNDKPVVLLYGDSPAWRELSIASTPADDIRQLEENLVALGYDPDGEIKIDNQFDAATERAVRRWEASLGLSVDGVVQLGAVVFLPGGVQVNSHLLLVGSAVGPGAGVLDVLPTQQIATVRGWYPYDVAAGIVSDLPDVGAEIERGQVLYRYAVDDGVDWSDAIFDRDLSVASTPGADIQALEERLVALGYDPLSEITVDQTFDAATAAAVTRWEEDLGVPVNGVVELEQLAAAEQPELRPVVAMFGDAPLVRRLDTSSALGSDIRQLEENLVALGYDPQGAIEVDEVFDAATAEAVERWEEELGLEADGAVDAGQVVMVPEGSQVTDVFFVDGASVARDAPVLEAAASARVITAQAPVDDVDLLHMGDEVEIELPDGSTVVGRVAEIGQTAYVAEEAQGGETVVDVTIALGTFESEISLTVLPVEIHVATQRAEGVMAAPVNALLALAEGGYAVEVIEGATTRLVGIETGMYADGWVEISGAGLQDGMQVVTP